MARTVFPKAECNGRSSDYGQGQPRVARAKTGKIKQELSYYHFSPCEEKLQGHGLHIFVDTNISYLKTRPTCECDIKYLTNHMEIL